MIQNKNAIKAALERAILEKMIAKTRKMTGNQDIKKEQLDSKMSIKD